MTIIKPIIEIKPKSFNKVHNNPLLNRIFQNRGISSEDELKYDLHRLHHPNLMKGLKESSEALLKHIDNNSKILIIGDYDCDGATATTIAVQGLSLLGAKNIDFLIPNRMVHGYGLTPSIVKVASELKPDLIVTVDNGISSFDGAKAVDELPYDCDLIITDHHLAPEKGLPEAKAIVNPNQPDCQFPSKSIAGCGVMFYVVLGLRAHMRNLGRFKNLSEPSLESLLDILALGTIADVVELDHNNRILVNAGLKYMNEGLIRPGMKHIAMLKKRRIGDLVSSDMGFAIGPCLNAAGRLDDMSIGIKCLLENDDRKALNLAETLNDLNETRKEMEHSMVEIAIDAINEAEKQGNKRGICLYDPTWHEGVIGIVASRIKDRMNRPIICFTDTSETSDIRDKIKLATDDSDTNKIATLSDELKNSLIKASCRSVPGIHLKHLLDKINNLNPNILVGYGGHAMAAGLSIRLKDYRAFAELFDQLVSNDLTEEMIQGEINVDIKNIPSDWITVENAELIRKSGPWGQKFETPVFSQVFDVVRSKVLCDKHLKLTVKVPGENKNFEAIAFNCVEDGVIPIGERFESSFSLDINEWNNKRSLQLMLQNLQEPEYTLYEKNEKRKISIPGAAQQQKLETCASPGI